MIRRSLEIAFVGAALLLVAGATPAQDEFQTKHVGRLFVDAVVPAPDGERFVDVYLRAETAIGEPLDKLDTSALVVRDNGVVIDSGNVTVRPLADAGAGVSAVLLLQSSRTLQGEPFMQAKAASMMMLDHRVGEYDHVAIVSFDDDVTIASTFDAPRTATRLAVEELETQPKALAKLVWDAVNEGIQLLRARDPSLPRRSLVILFSDGQDSNSVHTLDEVIRAAAGNPEESRIPIFTIGFYHFGGPGLPNLQKLSRETGGSYFEVSNDSLNELQYYFGEIWKRTTRSFVLRYPGDMDGKLHTVEVTMEQQTDSRQATYPEIALPWWPFAAGGGALVVAALGLFFAVRTRSAGRLIYEGGARSGEEAITLRGSKVSVGALDDNDLVLDYPTISRYHAKISIRRNKVEVDDLGSKNGTFINGTPVRGRSELTPGDRLRLGDVELVYRT